MNPPDASPIVARVAKLQGWYYAASGIWPLVSGGTFQAVTGPKADFWLAQTVGLLLAITGAVLILAARAGRVTPEIKLLGILQAAALALVDGYCVFQPRTTLSYLLDAVVELGLVAAWSFARIRK
jgi:hypothetical protein